MDAQDPQPLNVLVVEDEPRYLESTRLLLRHYGHMVTTARDGAQARTLLADWGHDVVLLDLHLPDATGLDILADMAPQLEHCMVIVVSGDTSIDSAIRALKAGAYDFLRKPYKPEELVKSLRNAARELTLRRENRVIQARLERSEQWHRFLVNNSPDIIYTLDAEGRFSYVNACVEAITGQTKAELLGQPWEPGFDSYPSIFRHFQPEIPVFTRVPAADFQSACGGTYWCECAFIDNVRRAARVAACS